MGLKEIYFEWENKWYDFLDKANEKIPIYKIIDPVDKIVPSFALFLSIIGILVLWGAFILLLPGVALTLTFEDSLGNPVSGLNVTYSFGAGTATALTNSSGMLDLRVPPNSTVEIIVEEQTVNGTGIQRKTEFFEMGEENLSRTVSLRTGSALFSGEKTLIFEDAFGIITGEPIKANFSCSDSSVEDWVKEDSDEDGRISFEVPEECERLTINVNESEYEAKTIVFSGEETQVVVLVKEMPPGGTLEVEIRDENDKIVSSDFLITVTGLDETQKQNVSYGATAFEDLIPGTYTVSVSDNSGEYSSGYVSSVVVNSGETTKTEILISKNIKGTIKVTVKDKVSGSIVENAVVQLQDELGVLITEKNTGELAETVQFLLFEGTDFQVMAKKAGDIGTGYFANIVENVKLNDNIIIEIEKMTPANTGRIKVNVTDESGKKVSGALVYLRYAEDDSIINISDSDAIGNAKETDLEGEANFLLNVFDKEVYPFAVKYPAQAGSKENARLLDEREENVFNIQMVIGESVLKIKAVDETGLLVPESFYQIFKSNGEKLVGTQTLVTGEGSYTLKADEKIFIIAENENFQSYQSNVIQLWPKQDFEITAKLLPKLLAGPPEIKFLGLFNDKKSVTTPLAGKTYSARFELTMPVGEDIDKAGVHVRAGDTKYFENDALYINNVKASNYSAVIRGKSFDSPLGENEELTEGKAKWVNIEWENPLKTTTEFEVDLTVKPDTESQEPLHLNYRAWIKTGDGKILRQPEDIVLGLGGSNATRNELYAETESALWFEGVNNLCSGEFCLDLEELFGFREQLFVEKKDVIVSSDYNYSFRIRNDSDDKYDSVEFFAESIDLDGEQDDGLLLKDYKIKTGSGNFVQGSELNGFKIDGVDLEEFSKGESITGEITLMPQKAKANHLRIWIVADKRIVFDSEEENKLIFNAEDEDVLNMEIVPETIPAFLGTELSINFTDEKDKAVENVLVSVKINAPGYSNTLNYSSNEFGNVKVNLLGRPPGTTIKITGQKTGFKLAVKEFEINPDPLTVSGKLNFSLNTQTVKEDSKEITIKNETAEDFEIIDMFLSIENVPGIEALDQGRILAHLESLEGIIVEQDSEKLLTIKAMLRQDAQQLISDNVSLDGTLTIIVKNNRFNFNHALTLDEKISIKVGATPDDIGNGCVFVEGINVPEWESSTLGSPARTQFDIINRCRSGSVPIELEKIRAKLNLGATPSGMGTVNLQIGSTTSELPPNRWVDILFAVEPEKPYSATLIFTPRATQNFLGERADFEIEWDAIVIADGKETSVEVVKDIQAEIGILDLQQCLEFDGRVVLGSFRDTTDFSIENVCNNVTLNIDLCKNDPGCKGGTTEGGIEFPDSRDRRFNLASGEQRIIEVGRGPRDIPGIYGIGIHAGVRGGNTAFRSQIKAGEIDLIVEPSPSDYFYFKNHNYDFELIGLGASDEKTLVNTMLLETPRIRANYCQLDRAAGSNTYYEESFQVATAILTVGGLSAWLPAVIAVGVAALLDLFGIGDTDCSDRSDVVPWQDFVIRLGDNIESDCGTITTDRGIIEVQGFNDFTGEWVGPAETSKIGSNLSEEIGLKFTNNSGAEFEKPTYAIGVIQAKEHIHGDSLHTWDINPGQKPHDIRGKGRLCPTFVPDSDTTTYEQKLHLRFKTKALPEEGLIAKEAQQCVSDFKVGHTGSNALPKIELNWEWGSNGIQADSCDADNPEGIYCDATQFSIALSKKINTFDEFLAANNYDFACPDNWPDIQANEAAENENNENSSQSIQNGKIGLSNLAHSLSGENATIIATIQNKGSEASTATVSMTINGPDGYSDSCDVTSGSIDSGNNANVECDFTGLKVVPDDFYSVAAQVTDSNPVEKQDSVLTRTFTNFGSSSSCWLERSTRKVGETQLIELWLNENLAQTGQYVNENNVVWTTNVSGFEALHDLLHFRAQLIRDGYTSDFRKDFAEFYTTSSFFDAPGWFASDSTGKLADYFASPDNRIRFVKQWNKKEDAKLATPGEYAVDIDVIFEDDWSFYNNAQPNTNITIVLDKIQEPVPNSPFYYIPFNGETGLDSSNGRQGYGVNYSNEDDKILLKDLPRPLDTTNLINSNPLFLLKTDVEKGFRQVNSISSTRGIVLTVDQGSNEKEKTLVFAPSFATPITMHAEQQNVTEENFSEYFQLFENSQAINVGPVLSYWNGMGQCKDFTGGPISQEFDYYADRQATQSDQIGGWQQAYAIDWPFADKTGDVYLYTTIYTPASKDYLIASHSNSSLNFFTPNEIEAVQISAQGVLGMTGNDMLGADSLSSLQEVFDLVESETLCVSENGLKSEFFWNPEKLWEASGSNVSQESFSAGLTAGNSCIG